MLKTLIEGLEKLAKLDSIKVVLLVSVGFNIYQYRANNDIQEEVKQEIRRQLPEELRPIKESVDSATFNVNEFVKELKR